MKSGGDVIVVGGGVIGCAVALRLRQRGLGVTLVERGRPGEEASSAAGGILAPQAEAHGPGPLLDLLLRSRARWRAFADELQGLTGIDVGYRSVGTLVVAGDEDEAARLQERALWQRQAGLSVELLDGGELRAREPALSAAVLALRLPDDHQVDNRQ